MKNIKFIIIIIPIFLIQSCKSSFKCFKEPISVFNANKNILPKNVCGYEERFSPIMEDIAFAENAICHSDSLVYLNFYDTKLKNYRRKFIGFINDNGEKILVVSLEHKKLYKDKNNNNSVYFDTDFNQGFGEIYEKYQRILSVNLVNGKVSFPCGN